MPDKNLNYVPKEWLREDRLKEIQNIIRANKDITAIELFKKFGVSEKTIKRDFKKLQEDNVIVRVGTSKLGYWEIV